MTTSTLLAPVDAIIASVACQRIVALFATTTEAMRAKDIWLALGLGTAANDTETMRAKLKLLVARQILIEAEPRLFSLAPAAPPA